MSGLIQRARDIAAAVYIQQESGRTKVPDGFTAETWAKHVSQWAAYMRAGCYDDELSFQAALMALKSIDVSSVLLAVVDATRAYLPPDGISEHECINRILDATDNREIAPIINAADELRSAAA